MTKTRKVFVDGNKVKKGDILTNEILTFEYGSVIVVEDENGTRTTHSEYGEERIDSLHNYDLKWKPISDSIGNLLCEPKLTSPPNYTGPCCADAPLHIIDVVKEHDAIVDFSNIKLKWEKVRNIHGKSVTDKINHDKVIYYVVISDISGFKLKLFQTTNTFIELDLTELESYYDLHYSISSENPCGISEEVGILNQKWY